MKTKEQNIQKILNNLKVLKKDCEYPDSWDTKDIDNWECMVYLLEEIEQLIVAL